MIERARTRARRRAKVHPVMGVCCDTGVAADAHVTPGVKKSVLRFPGTAFRQNWSVGGAERRWS